jgi:hypothetical protein
LLFTCLICSLILRMPAISRSETSLKSHNSTWGHIPEYNTIQYHDLGVSGLDLGFIDVNTQLVRTLYGWLTHRD